MKIYAQGNGTNAQGLMDSIEQSLKAGIRERIGKEVDWVAKDVSMGMRNVQHKKQHFTINFTDRKSVV